MSTLRFRNFTAAFRKPMLAQFGLIQEGSDVAWIENVLSPPSFVDLRPLIAGGPGQVYTLPITPSTDDGSVELFWNGVKLTKDVAYTLSGYDITMMDGYEPSDGDTLEAYIWGAS